jgi:hypothetical protein
MSFGNFPLLNGRNLGIKNIVLAAQCPAEIAIADTKLKCH